ncbi:protein C21orf2 homolog isoform X2 [Cimex lectularius]|uniref:U2A'/phosphoprotein 32 family A C-terminal domain-containing protein n=1 Tax=Cimex lectularius TaxID=79782 RepID=A0A8I6RSI6_CIMLE|nr:protein C21orf2 homolog isoform X2 [Cimex lectularius]
MVVLTEEMLIARTKQSNLKAITKLNCWGSQLSDVSILRRMTNVVVLSLSVNSITSLVDFQFCKKLQDLFIRKNNIQDLNEVVYLKDLEHLKHLWLGENPCANVDGYRLAVIRALPKLQKLDDDPIDSAEVQKALKYGRVLIHPEQIGEYYSDPDEEYEPEYTQEPQDNSPSPDESPVEPTTRNSYSPEPIVQYQREREHVPNNTTNETEQHYNDVNQHGDCVSDADMYRVKYDEKMPDVPQRPPQIGVIHRSRTLPQERCYSPDLVSSNNSYVVDPGYRTSTPVYANSNTRNQPNVQSEAEFSYNNDWKRRSCQSTCCIQGTQKRPNERRTNVLNAVLCLVKELDYPNLEVVQMAVKCRMEELAEM